MSDSAQIGFASGVQGAVAPASPSLGALVPSWDEPFSDPERERYWEQLIAEARSDPEYAEILDREIPLGKERRPEPVSLSDFEPNPAWEQFGFRGQVAILLMAEAKSLFERGEANSARRLRAKAIRFANCGKLARPGVCSRYPFEHKFFVPHPCSVIFCAECASEQRESLFLDYLEVIRRVICKHGIPPGWVLARITLTLLSHGREIDSSRVRKMNDAAHETLYRSVGSRRGYGALIVDEVGFELRGHVADRETGGLNLHLHGLYFGPFLDWEKTRDEWMKQTKKRFGEPSRGFFITRVRGFERDPEGAVRHALNHMLKYTSKPPAVSPERVASLILAFHGARRIRSWGLFNGSKPKREKKDCLCPKCRALGIPSIISFEGEALPGGGCIPRLVLVDELREQGYESLRETSRTTILSMGASRQDSWGQSP